MCLACGCNGKHLKADGSCLCGCPALVTTWPDAPMQPVGASVSPPLADVDVAAPLPFDDSDEKAKP